MTLLAEYIPKHRRKLVGLEGETHFAGPLEDKILGLAHLGDAGEVSLDIGREYRNARTRKSLGHHLQRNGFSGSGGAGDQTMVICKAERQPGGLFTLADVNLLVGIGHLVVGCSHLHRLFARIGVRAIIIPHVASRLKPINAIWGTEARLIATRSTGLVRSVDESLRRMSLLRQTFLRILCCSCIGATLVTRSRVRMRSSLVIGIAEGQDIPGQGPVS